MKALGSVLLLSLLCAAAAAQEAAATPPPHGVAVLKARWEKRVNTPPPVYDVTSGDSDQVQLVREQQASLSTNKALIQMGQNPVRPPTAPRAGKKDSPPVDLRANQVYYLYEAKVTNNGAKKIRTLVWDYILVEPGTQQEVGHHQFETKVGLGAGQTKSVTAYSLMPPATTVNVSKSDKQVRGQYTERVDISHVVYEDGTVWESAPDK